MTYQAKAAEEKKQDVQELVALMNEYPIIGAVNMANLPAAQLQRIRKQLREKSVVIKMTKRRLIKIAFEQSNKSGLKDLSKHLEGMPALIFAKENPFGLFKIIQKNKSRAPAKPGQIAPNDIVVEAGPTPFAPGPVIGEFGKVGIKAGIDAGKVVIKETKTVVHKGESVNPILASLLMRLGIEPMEIGLDLVAVYENGTIFTKDVLGVDEVKVLQDVKLSWQEAINLSVYAGYPTKDSVNIMLQKASRESRAISLSQAIMTIETRGDILAIAESQGKSLKTKSNWEG